MSSFLYGYQNKIIIVLFIAFEIFTSTNKVRKIRENDNTAKITSFSEFIFQIYLIP